MLTAATAAARAYVNHGRWVSDCPRKDCAGAERLEPRQTLFRCSNCRLLASVEWPSDADGIWEALLARPVPQTRNWFPAGHDLALRWGLPHGQTVAELHAETAEHLTGEG